MVYKIVYGNIGNCKQLFQTWKTGSFMNGSSRMNASQYSSRFNGSDHEYTLSEPTAVVSLLSDSTWTPFHPWKMLYHRLQGSSTSGKPVLPWRQVNILVIHTGSNHEQTLSTTVIYGAVAWLQLATFPPMEDALPWTTRPFNTWKPVLPWTVVNVLTISTDQAKFCTFSLQILLLLVYSAFWYWLRWLQCNWFIHGRLL